jgi:signal transduction histidine kinase
MRWRLMIYIVVPLIASLGLTGSLSLSFLENQVEQRLKKDLELVARAIRLPVGHALQKQRPGSVASALQSVFSLGSVYSAYVYDTEGRQIASAGRSDPRLQRGKVTELAGKRQHTGEYGTIGDRDVYSYYVPLTDSNGQARGLLHLTRRQSDFRQDISTIRLYGIMLLGTGALVMTGLVLIGHYQALGRNFTLLTFGMARITAGDRHYRMPLTGPREMVEIQSGFNVMLDSIEQSEEALYHQRGEQLELEKQLRQKEKLAAIGQLAAGIAHELGTPLSVISGHAQRSARGKGLDPQLKNTLEQIRKEVDKMSHIVRQLLEFSRHEVSPRALVNPERVVRAAVAAVQGEAERFRATLTSAIIGEPPAIQGDPVRLEQAVVNLLRNAIQAGGRPMVRLHCYPEQGLVCFQVDDDGPGIPLCQRERIFEPFFTTKPVGAGTGLGLAVVHAIVQEHGGTIAVGESVWGGASFCLRLAGNSPVHDKEGPS